MIEVDIDTQTKIGRRFENICAELSAKFGPSGPETLVDKLRARSTAVLTLRLEILQSVAATGGNFDPAALVALTEATVAAINQLDDNN